MGIIEVLDSNLVDDGSRFVVDHYSQTGFYSTNDGYLYAVDKEVGTVLSFGKLYKFIVPRSLEKTTPDRAGISETLLLKTIALLTDKTNNIKDIL